MTGREQELEVCAQLNRLELAVESLVGENTFERMMFDYVRLTGVVAAFRAGVERKSTEILAVRADPRSGGALRNHLSGDAGFDLSVWFPDREFVDIGPGEFVKLPTGLNIKVGENAWGCIRPRSSTFFHKRLFVMEGTIDSGYTGPMFVIVFNPTQETVRVENGDRMAQLIPIPRFTEAKVKFVDALPETERGARGFGSTNGVRE